MYLTFSHFFQLFLNSSYEALIYILLIWDCNCGISAGSVKKFGNYGINLDQPIFEH